MLHGACNNVPCFGEMKMARKKKVELIAYQRVLNTIPNYIKEVKRGQQVSSNVVNTFIEDIKPFLTRKGTLKKSAIRTNKQRQTFNKIVTNFKENPYSSVRFRKKIAQKIVQTSVKNKVYNIKEATNVLSTFSDDVARWVIDYAHMDSGQVVKMAKEYSFNNIYKIAKMLKNEIENKIPLEMRTVLKKEPYTDDDVYNTLIDALEKLKNG